MKQVSHFVKSLCLTQNADAAFCRNYDPKRPFYEGFLEWFGTGNHIGHPMGLHNKELREELKKVFVSFCGRHVNEQDPQTCILRTRADSMIVFDGEHKYAADYQNRTVETFGCRM